MYARTREAQEKFIAEHPVILKIIHVAMVLSVVVFGAVVAALGIAGVRTGEQPEGAAGDSQFFLTLLTAINLGNAAVALVLAWWLPSFLSRRRAGKVAQATPSEAVVFLNGSAALWNRVLLRDGFLESCALFGLVFCLLALLLDGPSPFCLNALTVVPCLVHGVLAFPTRERREAALAEFARLVDEQVQLRQSAIW